MSEFTIKNRLLTRIGTALKRPECVLCTAAGLFTSHFGGGVTWIGPGGAQRDIIGSGGPTVATNGFAITRGGDFLCANLLPPGGVWRVMPSGQQTPFWTEIDGYAPPSVNFVHVDAQDRAWITVSTRREPRSLGYRPDVDDGFIVLVNGAGQARLAAAGLGFTNEAKIDPSGRWLYVNETFTRRTSRFPVATDGRLGQRETVAEYGTGVWPDGLEFDCENGVWITSILSNRVIRLMPDGQQRLILEDNDPERLAELEHIYQAGQLDRPHMDQLTTTLKSISSLAFGGPRRKTAYLGNLLDDCVYAFASPVAGAEPAHWNRALWRR